jgi:hypothetical protein
LKELSKEAMPVLATLAAVALLCFGVARAGPRVAGPEACALYAVDIQSTSGERIMAATLARSAEAAQRISAIGGVNTHALR